MAKIYIPYSALYHWYVEEKLTAEEIGRRMNCSEQTIRRRLTEYGIPIRERGPQPISGEEGEQISREWSPDLAYVIGLIAADGNLSPDERHITFISKDRQLHEIYKQCLGISNKTSWSHRSFRTTFGSVVFYQWLLTIGLMPDKTFKMRKIKVPHKYFADFVRGYLDGDGNINVYQDDYNARKHQNEKYIYWRLYVRLYSANHPFLKWLQEKIERLVGVKGRIVNHGDSAYTIQYAKKDSLMFLSWLYYHPDLPCLERKRAQYHDYLAKIGQRC
jgi:signal peptidase I